MDKNSKKSESVECISDVITDKTSKHWDEAIEKFIDAISKDTICTELIKILIQTFFKDDSLGIFSLLTERSRNMLHKDDVRKEFKLRQKDIEKIKESLINYRDASKSGRANHMENLVKLCDNFYNNLVTGKNMDNVHLLTIAITFMFVHLTILRERNRHSKEIYSKENKSYETDLRQKVQDYKQYFISMYYKWEEWRKGFIHYQNIDGHYQVHDEFHKFHISYKRPNSSDEATRKKYHEICEHGKFAFLNEAKFIFINVYLHTFALNKFLPNNWSAPSEAHNKEIGTLYYGIVGRVIITDPEKYGNDYEEPFKLSSEEPGIITGLNVHYSDVVHGLTVKYRGRPCSTVGNVKGGEATTVRGLDEDNYVNSVEIFFGDQVISGIQFNFNGNRTTGVLGNQENTRMFCGGPTKDFKLTAIQMAPSKSFSKKHDCLGYTLLTFEHLRIAKD
ncbi:glutamate-rich protein 3 [Gigaspora margarita]|uniref:Glutamate-rich protein 3 n=1 Tax=Gigaspora margarita TaxID=4874 RepID=A0A8H4B559_GIGMA|nr:glutamate-rich protein 3 [Gigaspora margarita]